MAPDSSLDAGLTLGQLPEATVTASLPAPRSATVTLASVGDRQRSGAPSGCVPGFKNWVLAWCLDPAQPWGDSPGAVVVTLQVQCCSWHQAGACHCLGLGLQGVSIFKPYTVYLKP